MKIKILAQGNNGDLLSGLRVSNYNMYIKCIVLQFSVVSCKSFGLHITYNFR